MFRLAIGLFIVAVVAAGFATSGIAPDGPLERIGTGVSRGVAPLRAELEAERLRRQQETGCCALDPDAWWSAQF